MITFWKDLVQVWKTFWGRMPLHLDLSEFTCTHKLVFLNAVSSQVACCPAALEALIELHRFINLEKDKRKQRIAVEQFGP